MLKIIAQISTNVYINKIDKCTFTVIVIFGVSIINIISSEQFYQYLGPRVSPTNTKSLLTVGNKTNIKIYELFQVQIHLTFKVATNPS